MDKLKIIKISSASGINGTFDLNGVDIDLDNSSLKDGIIKLKSSCMHDQCKECSGSGVKSSGEPCVHYISCPCERCTPQF